MVLYITLDPSRKIVSQWDARHSEDEVQVEVDFGQNLCDLISPWYYVDGKLTQTKP